MSQVKDSEGNVINRPPVQFLDGNGNVKYSGEHADTLDWYDTHPEDRPKEEVLPSAEDLDKVAGEQSTAEATATPSLDNVIVVAGKPVAIIPDAEANAVVAQVSEALTEAKPEGVLESEQ